MKIGYTLGGVNGENSAKRNYSQVFILTEDALLSVSRSKFCQLINELGSVVQN